LFFLRLTPCLIIFFFRTSLPDFRWKRKREKENLLLFSYLTALPNDKIRKKSRRTKEEKKKKIEKSLSVLE
jgi:hypothetical protein